MMPRAKILVGGLFWLLAENLLLLIWLLTGNRFSIAAFLAILAVKVELLAITSIQAQWARRP